VASARPERTQKDSILWNFTGGADGANPIGGIVADAAGNLYGGTISSGAHDQGTIFKLVPSGNTYRETTLLAFNGSNGSSSSGILAMDPKGALFDGTLFGTTTWGGAYGLGAAFGVSKDGTRESVIWSFGSGNDGVNPTGMTIDAKGELFGTTVVGVPSAAVPSLNSRPTTAVTRSESFGILDAPATEGIRLPP
jgi:uncharacterized repeat protein (TIGR03803 family)